MALSGSENRTAHALNHVATQATVDCFTPHEVTDLRVGRIICHEEHREITPTGLCAPRFHAPLHIFPHLQAQQGVRLAAQGAGALVVGIQYNFANIGPRNSIELLIRYAVCWDCQF